MRKFLLGLFAIALSVTLVACGNSEETNVDEENASEETSEETSEEALYFEDGKVTLEDGTEVQLGTKEVNGNIVIDETAVLPDGEKVLSEVTYVYDGETLKEVNVVMTARTHDYANTLASDKDMIGAGIDEASVTVKGNKVYAKMGAETIAEMSSVPKSMMLDLLVK